MKEWIVDFIIVIAIIMVTVYCVNSYHNKTSEQGTIQVNLNKYEKCTLEFCVDAGKRAAEIEAELGDKKYWQKMYKKIEDLEDKFR